MRAIITIISFFILGLILGSSSEEITTLCSGDLSSYILYAMMLIVGMGIGCDRGAIAAIRKLDKKIIMLPICTIAGTLIGTIVLYPLVSSIPLKDALAVSSGFGYYSLSSILLTEYRGAEIGTMALLSNVIREVGTILIAPLLARYFGRFSIISSAGVTSIDTLLPIISRFSGKEYIVIAIFHGVVLEITVPILVTLFASL